MVFVLFESAYDDCHSYLKERAGLDGEEACELFRQIVQIVHALHQRGIVLNDLKLAKFLFADSKRQVFCNRLSVVYLDVKSVPAISLSL